MEINLVKHCARVPNDVFSLQTSLREGNIVISRIVEPGGMVCSHKKKNQNKGPNTAARITQPISPPVHQPSQADTLSNWSSVFKVNQVSTTRDNLSANVCWSKQHLVDAANVCGLF